MTDEYDPLDFELENLKRLNGVLEQVLAAMNASTTNVENVNSTVKNADKLLDLWIRVLASSDASQKLILDENWNGATSDLQAIEQEQSQASLRAQELREAANRKQEEQLARQQREREEKEKSDNIGSSRTARGRGSVSRGGMTRPPPKKEVVSAYAQTSRPKSNPASSLTAPTAASLAHANGSLSSSGSTPGTGRGARGRGAPIVVRGTRASRGRQAGVGRAQENAFK